MINANNLFADSKIINNIKISFNCLIIEIKIIKLVSINL